MSLVREERCPFQLYFLLGFHFNPKQKSRKAPLLSLSCPKATSSPHPYVFLVNKGLTVCGFFFGRQFIFDYNMFHYMAHDVNVCMWGLSLQPEARGPLLFPRLQLG